MDYGNLLRRSWDIVWKNKFMFLLGFLAALGSGGGGGNSASSSNFRISDNDMQLPPEMVENISRYWRELGGVVLAVICLLFILGIVLWLVRLVAQTGLIDAASRIDDGGTSSFGAAMRVGASKLTSMAGLNLLMFGPFILFGLIAAGVAIAFFGPVFGELLRGNPDPNFNVGAFGVVGACLGVIGCLMVPLALIVNVIYPFAQRGLVLRNLGIVDSIRHGWQVVKENVGDVILIIVIFLVIGFLFGLASLIVLLPFAFLAFGPAVFSMIQRGMIEARDIIFMVGGGICLGLVAAVVNSILISYRSTAVTLAYKWFVGKQPQPAKVVEA